jgi:hypothetical protein
MNKILTTLSGAVLAAGVISIGVAHADPTPPTPNPNPAPGLQYCPGEGWATIGSGGQWITGPCPAGAVGPYLPGLPGPGQPSPFNGGGR